MKYFISILVLLLSFSAFAATTISTEGTNASNVIKSPYPGGGPSFFYSNVSGVSDGATPPNWAPGNGTAGSCTAQSFLINPNCRDATQLFNFSAEDSAPTTGASRMYVIYLAPGSTWPSFYPGSPGVLISTLGTQVFHFPYTANHVSGANLHFGDICSVLSSSGLPINSYCVQTDPSIPLTAQLFLVADANGDGYLSAGETFLPFTFTVQSQIPINSSAVNQVGLYGFQFYPGDGEVFLVSSEFGPGAGMFGASAVKFYYVAGPDIYNSFDEHIFNAINADLNPPDSKISSAEFPLNADGTVTENYIQGLKNGTSYYFRAAVVDSAGNTGYLTPSVDDDPSSVTPPMRMHAAKPWRFK